MSEAPPPPPAPEPAEARRSLWPGGPELDPAWFRLLFFFGGLALALVVVIRFDKIFFPLLTGLAIAYLFDPAVSWFERHGRSRSFGVLMIVLAMLLAAAGFLFYVVPAVSDQVARLGERLPQYRAQVEHQFGPWLERLEARYPEEFAKVQAKARAALEENLPDLAGAAGAWLGKLFGSLLHVVLVVLNLVFIPVFTFYLLVDFPKIKRGARELIPLPYRPMVLDRLAEVDRAIAGFVRGQLTIAVILAVVNAVGLALAGVPIGIAIGLAAGLANFIPYMSLIVGLAPALLLSWVEHQSLARLGAVVLVFTLGHMLESLVLQPRILGRSVDLHPVWVLLAVLAGGSLFGLIGMLVAVPTAAAIQVFVRHWIKLYKASRIYTGDVPAAPAELGD
ncbi:MAG TPA: AI-2E family transporter [Thermoanaerobaculia bacterium]|nr:AI-2E family transporter [Thermoanaerobaculia bacterium]